MCPLYSNHDTPRHHTIGDDDFTGLRASKDRVAERYRLYGGRYQPLRRVQLNVVAYSHGAVEHQRHARDKIAERYLCAASPNTTDTTLTPARSAVPRARSSGMR